ncbi:MAG TPA: GNAT family N-acetyltransferase [Polyangiaceae bacterium]
MQIRDARLEDLPEVTQLHNELILATTFTWTEQPQSLEERTATFEARTARGFPTLVADDGGTILGTATFGDFRDSIRWPGYRFYVEHSVNVFQNAWGQGVGQKLMMQLFERARALRIHVMIGGIDASNIRSLAFHERLGFREVARMPETGWKHGRWCDLVLVQRLMDEPGAPRDG